MYASTIPTFPPLLCFAVQYFCPPTRLLCVMPLGYPPYEIIRYDYLTPCSYRTAFPIFRSSAKARRLGLPAAHGPGGPRDKEDQGIRRRPQVNRRRLRQSSPGGHGHRPGLRMSSWRSDNAAGAGAGTRGRAHEGSRRGGGDVWCRGKG